MQGAGADDHLPARAKGAHNPALLVFDADRAAAVKQDAPRPRAALHPQIGAPTHERLQIGARGAPPFAVLLGQLIEAAAFLLLAVEIVAHRKIRLARGLDEDRVEGIVRSRTRHIERAVRAMQRAGEILVGLRLDEIGQDVGPGPTARALSRPAIRNLRAFRGYRPWR